jgi:hypothetical protein
MKAKATKKPKELIILVQPHSIPKTSFKKLYRLGYIASI